MSARSWITAAVLLLFSVSAQALTIGPSQTKRERLSVERQAARRGAPQKTSAGPYEAVMQSFLSGDFRRSENLAATFSARGGPASGGRSRDNRADEVAMIRALSLMKLGRFAEARPILENLERSSVSPELRAQAGYSLGDSYYFQNDRTQADVYYKRAVERYPGHGEAKQVRRLLGLSHAAPLHQMGIEESVLFSVQVGAFSKRRNAERLLNRLMRNRYDAYISQEEKSRPFRVRVGHLTAREDAQSLESRLKKDGYPTKIFP